MILISDSARTIVGVASVTPKPNRNLLREVCMRTPDGVETC